MPRRPWDPDRRWLLCPICRTGWSTTIKRAGGRCGDLSQTQIQPCVGRLIPAKEMKQAEWRMPYVWDWPGAPQAMRLFARERSDPKKEASR